MLDALKPYSAYKPCHEWIGDVPSHWDIVPGFAAFREKQVKNTGMVVSDVLSLSYGRIVIKPPEKLHGLVPASFETYQIVDPGDIIIRPTDLQNDWHSIRVGLSGHRGIITSAYICLQPTSLMTPAYCHLLLLAYDMRKFFYGMGSGLRQSLDYNDFKRFPMLLPPPAEQAGIVRFLGEVDRKVNRFIRAKRRLIEVLTEQKQAIITHAVTKGLNPHVPLKRSGIDWLGDVPAHWEVLRLRNLVSQVTSGSRGWSRYMADTGPLFIRIGNLTRGSLELDMSDAARLQLPKDASEVHRTRAQANDILVSITAYIGSFAVVPEGIEEAYVSQHVALCRPRPTVHNARWVGYVLLSPIGQAHGKFSLNGGTKDGLSLDDVKNHPVLMPPPDEQDHIVAWIESESAQLNASIAAIKREIDLIREYRTRLVADVVTGKVDVRGVSLPNEEQEDVVADAEIDGQDESGDDETEQSLTPDAEEAEV